MLVELDGPELIEVNKAAPSNTLFGKETGKTELRICSGSRDLTWHIDLTYPEFRWALACSIRNGEPFFGLEEGQPATN
jgi:hypothetical protein